ncbi:RALGAPA2 [Bugula neritina]|uniref:RALGAPA2 n=1 Tax=Bugula neritina TaxID=10212 RepID=A0A7J7JMR1_BUGNE|nr:RALGAPA2 [Bugula neritina]
MLGILGDVNGIKECKVHERVMEHLSDLQETLLKLSDNMNVSADNTSSQEPGEITSPIFYFFPICIKMLAKMCLRFDYLKLPPTHLTHFYNILHKTLTSTETEYNKVSVARQ